MLFCNFDFKLILNCQRQLKKKASYKHRMTVCHSQRFTRLDFQKFSPLAARFQKEASYKYIMTLTTILTGLQGLFFKKNASGG